MAAPALVAVVALVSLLVAYNGSRFEIEVHQGRVYIQILPDGVPRGSVQGKPTIDTGSCIELRKVEGKGIGAFAAKDIPKGSYFGEYVGDRISAEEYARRYPDGGASGEYCMAIDRDRVIDGAAVSRQRDTFVCGHINHAYPPRNNVARKAVRAGPGAIHFFAAQDIAAGEELLLDYGRGYWEGREQEVVE